MTRLIGLILLLASTVHTSVVYVRRPKATAACGTTSSGCFTGTDNNADVNWFYLSSSFVASETATVCSIDMRLKKTGTVTGTYRLAIYTDNSGQPGTLVGSWTDNYNRDDVTTSFATYNHTKSGGIGASLTSGTTYWVVINTSTCCMLDFYSSFSTDCYGGSLQPKQSDDATSWSTLTNNMGLKFQLYK